MTQEELVRIRKDAMYEQYQAREELAANSQRLQELSRKCTSLSHLLQNPLNLDSSSISAPTTEDIRTAIRDHEEAWQRHDNAEKACAKLRID